MYKFSRKGNAIMCRICWVCYPDYEDTVKEPKASEDPHVSNIPGHT